MFIELLMYLKRCINDSLTACPRQLILNWPDLDIIVSINNYMHRLTLPLITEVLYQHQLFYQNLWKMPPLYFCAI